MFEDIRGKAEFGDKTQSVSVIVAATANANQNAVAPVSPQSSVLSLFTSTAPLTNGSGGCESRRLDTHFAVNSESAASGGLGVRLLGAAVELDQDTEAASDRGLPDHEDKKSLVHLNGVRDGELERLTDFYLSNRRSVNSPSRTPRLIIANDSSETGSAFITRARSLEGKQSLISSQSSPTHEEEEEEEGEEEVDEDREAEEEETGEAEEDEEPITHTIAAGETDVDADGRRSSRGFVNHLRHYNTYPGSGVSMERPQSEGASPRHTNCQKSPSLGPRAISPSSCQTQTGSATQSSITPRPEAVATGMPDRYRPISSGRTLVIQRTPSSLSQTSLCGGSSVAVCGPISNSTNLWRSATMPAAGVSVMHSGVSNIVQGREREKKDLQQLNERFANYIEKVRFLEAQNRKLANELSQLRERWGKETERVKAMYNVEMDQLRRLLNGAEKAKAELELRLTNSEEQVLQHQHISDELQRQSGIDREAIDRLNRQLSEYEGELGHLKRRNSSLADERNKEKQEIKRLREEVKQIRLDLDHETMAHINAENESHSLRDELTFVKQVHETELKELAALAYRDTTQENRDFWKSEMSQALRDIQSEYDSKLETIKSELENYYCIKVQEVRNNSARGGMEMTQLREENGRIKTQLMELRKRLPDLEARNTQLERQLKDARQDLEDHVREGEQERNNLRKDLAYNQQELERTVGEFQAIVDAKLSLELEIAAYRKLLENEENRYGSRGPSSLVILPPAKHDSSAKTTYTRSAKGNISISECSPDGKYIILENNGKKRENLSGMKIVRHIDHDRTVVSYTIPPSTLLDCEGRGKSLRIWSRNQRPSGSCDVECSEISWGTGTYIRTVLLNNEGEERASHTQRTVFHM